MAKAPTWEQPGSGLERAIALLDEVRSTSAALLDHSDITLDDINARDTGVFVVGWNKWHWTPLTDAAQPHVGKTREAFAHLREFVDRAVQTAAPERATKLEDVWSLLERVIEQPNGSLPKGAPGSTIDVAKAAVEKTLDKCEAVVRSLPSAHGDAERLLVPDTSALLDRTDLQDWKLDGGAWTVVLVPKVLSELDERKRDERTRDAAQKIISQIEEFDRRGNTLVGVPLAGKLSYREVALGPDMSETLTWLRSDVSDDVIIAGALKLTWADLTARIAVTASDRNFRNKARLAGLTVIRPADL